MHGCPYKTFSQESLRSALSRMQVRQHHWVCGIRGWVGGWSGVTIRSLAAAWLPSCLVQVLPATHNHLALLLLLLLFLALPSGGARQD